MIRSTHYQVVGYPPSLRRHSFGASATVAVTSQLRRTGRLEITEAQVFLLPVTCYLLPKFAGGKSHE